MEEKVIKTQVILAIQLLNSKLLNYLASKKTHKKAILTLFFAYHSAMKNLNFIIKIRLIEHD